jgi:threonine aldolase
MKAQGVLCGTAAADEVRFVTHREVNRKACERAVSVLREVFERVGSAA